MAIAIATGVGLALNVLGINPLRALVFTAVFNGGATVPLLFVIAQIARDARIMGNTAANCCRPDWCS